MSKLRFMTLSALAAASFFTACSFIPKSGNGECKTFTQRVVVGYRTVDGNAVACPDDNGVWHVTSFKDQNGNDLPAPSEILYPQPVVIQTRPKTAFTPSTTINDMPMPHVTFYQQ